uniref:Uncharacterized protein n=1 Tax=Myoviridae sp. ctoNH1 TaxID=2826695 RepID=A0A8S5QT51_9CAUD|nr:MAG TPA: hypothetical protein [Myoviridae sp. ctoNH1]
MRAFTYSQSNMFLNAFGEPVKSNMGVTFNAILEVVPISVNAGGSFIEGTETFCTAKKDDVKGIVIGSVLSIKSMEYEVYNIVDDLSGLVNIYYRSVDSQNFAEDY